MKRKEPEIESWMTLITMDGNDNRKEQSIKLTMFYIRNKARFRNKGSSTMEKELSRSPAS